MSELNVEFRYVKRIAVYRNAIKVAELPEKKYTEWLTRYWKLRAGKYGLSWFDFLFDELGRSENSFFRTAGYGEGISSG